MVFVFVAEFPNGGNRDRAQFSVGQVQERDTGLGPRSLSFLFLETWVHSTCISRIANPEFFGTRWPAG